MPVNFSLHLNVKGRTVVIRGLLGIVLLFLIFSFPSLFAASLNPDKARDWILDYLRKEIILQHTQELQDSGLSLPTYATAERWQAETDEINQLKFESVAIKQFIFVPTLITSYRIFVVKVVFMDTHHQKETRYFSLSTRNKWFDYFLVAERSRLMWLLSI